MEELVPLVAGVGLGLAVAPIPGKVWRASALAILGPLIGLACSWFAGELTTSLVFHYALFDASIVVLMAAVTLGVTAYRERLRSAVLRRTS